MYLPYCIAQNHNYGSRQHVLHTKIKKNKTNPTVTQKHKSV